MKENVLVTVCARGGSKGVPGKNIRPLLGRPLLEYTLEHARSWPRMTDICVSTDSETIAETARAFGVPVPFLRSPALSGDEVGKTEVLRDAVLKAESLNQRRYAYVVDLDVTAPLRLSEDIEGTFRKLREGGHEVVVSVCEARRNPYFNLVELDERGRARLCKTGGGKVVSRQGAPAVYELNASIYVYRRSFFESGASSAIGPDTGIYLMPPERSWDIDREEDFQVLEVLMGRLLSAAGKAS